jgi:rod shape-determining protein MreC
MIKKKIATAVVVVIVGVGLFFDQTLRTLFLHYALSVKESFVRYRQKLHDTFAALSFQIQQLEQMRQELLELERYRLLCEQCRRELKKLDEITQAAFDPQDFELRVVRMISFVKPGRYTSAWLSGTGSGSGKKDKVYGLIGKNGVAGIAVQRQGRLMALFNGHRQTSYAVTIGRDILGIATGSGDNRYLLVKYIPSYAQVKKGQKVITNGFDAIFPYGVDVGEVEAVWLEGSYQVALVRTYEDLSDPLFFWLVWREANEDIK